MSAAGRGSARLEADNYPTPAWCTRRILEALEARWFPHEAPRSILEPCVGDGAIAEVLAKRYPRASVVGYDIRDVCETGGVVSYVHDSTVAGALGYDLVITNPPFSLAAEIIAAQLPAAGILALLLRSSFKLGPWRSNMPDEYRLPQRPEFIASEKCAGGLTADGEELIVISCGWAQKVDTGAARTKRCPNCGGKVQRSQSDASEYSWFVWTPERNRTRGAIEVLPDTPLEERKADRVA